MKKKNEVLTEIAETLDSVRTDLSILTAMAEDQASRIRLLEARIADYDRAVDDLVRPARRPGRRM